MIVEGPRQGGRRTFIEVPGSPIPLGWVLGSDGWPLRDSYSPKFIYGEPEIKMVETKDGSSPMRLRKVIEVRRYPAVSRIELEGKLPDPFSDAEAPVEENAPSYYEVRLPEGEWARSHWELA
jgi:hypothetical protein